MFLINRSTRRFVMKVCLTAWRALSAQAHTQGEDDKRFVVQMFFQYTYQRRDNQYSADEPCRKRNGQINDLLARWAAMRATSAFGSAMLSVTYIQAYVRNFNLPSCNRYFRMSCNSVTTPTTEPSEKPLLRQASSAISLSVTSP